ncbi:hypothetical protein KCH_30160 [Kitasatospora cheerisanensis KCTC 2395]|uniref:Uncharacterized protein n=1 Tax=Kitasatospora cheerisanensis KCTC 2395 TaxID=1348663 RepID=A0A066YVI0_9ACTN|nr:hypothetical protein KCH_30160 [Kitasatospora cheerisanensis KCTC 2395]
MNRTIMMPASVDEAVEALAATPGAVPVAGATDLMEAVNGGRLRPAALIGLGRITELRGWRYEDGGTAVLGAGLTHARMDRPDFAALIPALADAARTAGPPQVRNVGTLGGNIATGDPAGDTLPVLAALEATATLARPGTVRDVPISHLLTGLDPLRPGELLTWVRVPLLHAPQVFLKSTGRSGPSRAAASVALVLDPARRGVRCAVGAVAPSRCGRWRPRAGWPAASTGTPAARTEPSSSTPPHSPRSASTWPAPASPKAPCPARGGPGRRPPAAYRSRAGPPGVGKGAEVTDELLNHPGAFPGDVRPTASYTLRVNGVERPVSDAWIGESLLYVLRERLGLAGAKDGCEQGECGACSVQVDGQLVNGCLVPAALAADSEINTVEGLSGAGGASDVQQALADSGAVQCGYCTPGMAMAVHDLLQRNHRPSDIEARQALCGNLCRCTGYRGALAAVQAVADAREAALEAELDAAEQAAAGAPHPPPAHPPPSRPRRPRPPSSPSPTSRWPASSRSTPTPNSGTKPTS